MSKSTPIQTFLIALATSDFEDNQTPWRPEDNSFRAAFLDLQSSALRNYEKLDPQDCVARYINPLQATQSLIVVLSDIMSSNASSHSNVDYVGTTLISQSVHQQNSTLWNTESNWMCFTE